MSLKIKDQYKNHFVAFGGAGRIILGKRSQEDLQKLAIVGLQSKDKTILDLFEGQLPSLESLLKEQTAAMIKAGPKR